MRESGDCELAARIQCPKCGTANYSSDAACLNCGTALQVQQHIACDQPVLVSEPAPGLNAVTAALVGLIGPVMLAFALASWLDVTLTPEQTSSFMGRLETVQRDLPAVAFAAKLILGPLLMVASFGLFRLRRWAWWSAVGIFGISVISHVFYMFAVVAHGLFSTMIGHLFQPPLFFGIEVRLGGDVPFL